MKHRRNLIIATSFVAVLAALGIGQSTMQRLAAAQAQNSVQAPRFEVDPMWPKPLPNGWYQGQAIGVGANGQHHIWITHPPDSRDAWGAGASQNPPTAECCKLAPPI